MNEKIGLAVSVVTYKNDFDALKKLFDGLLGADLDIKIFVVDNSPTDEIGKLCGGAKFTYIFNGKNIGYGAGHNTAIRRTAGLSRYHLVVNPDIYFERGTLEKLFRFMEDNPGVGLVMPKVLYPDGSPQYLRRLLPTPFNMLLRKLRVPVLSRHSDNRYELRYVSYDRQMDAPYLSGCFMFIRSEVFEKVGLFDERFFMYIEDIDLSRRIHERYRTVYHPGATVYHSYVRGTNKDLKLLGYIISSTVKYFNKWGWFFDSKRSEINKETIGRIKK